MDIRHARTILDADHHDLEEFKDRILEYLTVRQLLNRRTAAASKNDDDPATTQGMILCFVGPPGVRKTSLGLSIARALGRAFTRMSLGGCRMKVMAAHRAGLTAVILPKMKDIDLEELPEEIRQSMEFHSIEGIDEAFDIVLLAPPSRKRTRK